MVNFLEGIHPRITEFLHNPPFIPVKLIPRIPATPTTDEIPEYYSPKPRKDWDENETELVDLASKCKRLLIMAIPNDIFESLDNCENSMNLWKELQKQLEGGVKAQKNNRTVCINEYHEFRAKDGESLKDTYSRLNVLINKCRRSGVIRSDEDNNMLFLKSLGPEWLHLTMSMRTTMDLEFTSLADLFGSLASQEPLVMQMKNRPLALMAEEGKKKEDEKTEEKKKKKKSITIDNSEEFNSSEDEVSAQEMMKVLALITKEYKKGFSNRGRGRESSYRRDDTEEVIEGIIFGKVKICLKEKMIMREEMSIEKDGMKGKTRDQGQRIPESILRRMQRMLQMWEVRSSCGRLLV
ncbi:LOW QUALITY PROTEIN: hypothetical protein OSB04_006480 [Centaurea solstitialis]|uniref:Uncharacterized protein n=1 Tax=Centaurea solstitialis TaxID=347529 RepID=A0AA38WQB6_9ASTR|nr:LOW QUALITY PROTEIN: hypothetical protein OSB04_006480 [Centaurea solstitialis]